MEIRGSKSNVYKSSSGVPQGSNMGPLLFILAINGLTGVVKHSKPLIFADDYKIFLEILTDDNCGLLQEDINDVFEWCAAKGFKLNTKKMCVYVIHTKQGCHIKGLYDQ